MAESSHQQVAIHADFSESVNYASWQNSVPFLRSLEVVNDTESPLHELRLELHTSPAFARKKEWSIQRLGSGERLAIRDRDPQFDPDYLNGLNEAERGMAVLRLYQGDQLITESAHKLRVLARDEWGGVGTSGEMLAAFVMPNDTAIPRLLKQAGRILAENGHSPSLDGYQSNDPRRAYLLASAVWSAVASESLTYSNPPSSFEQVGQKTRRPARILSDGLATCLDLTLLFASTLEAVGLNPVIVITEGHSIAGVWLVDKTMNRLLEPDCTEIRKALAAKELITFETTLITSHYPPGQFDDAVRMGADITHESREDEYIISLDVKRARLAQIRPLASHDSQNTEDTDRQHSARVSLAPVPDFKELPAENLDVKPTTPLGRIDRWQRKLLDLSLRNRLLNFKPTKQTVPLVCPNISLLEDKLADGHKLRLISLPDENAVGERDAELFRQNTKQDLETEFASQALEKNELSCPLSSAELEKRLTNVYRNVRNDLAEGGSNTLFLAVGFLKWKQKPEDSKSYRAPLILLPVKLTRKSAISHYHLSNHEDEIRFNATLIQLLKKDFDRDLSRFENDLPVDQSGVDVPLVLDMMRQEVREIPGFEVVEESALGTFSFAKYLMWKDLVDRSDQLEQNRVVRHLINDPEKPFESSAGAIPRPEEIDTRFEPKDLIYPLPADSSQLAAVMAASEGQDYVLVGPPGTGKSQTIANIISQCLATGKRVLFVAEKTAALDVVYRRLCEHGLRDCCVELHSNKADRRHFLEQLESAWKNNRRAEKNEWIEISERLKVRRDELNSYVKAIHEEHPNGWTAYRAMGLCVQGAQTDSPHLEWDRATQHSKTAYESLEVLIQSVSSSFGAINPARSLPAISKTEWSVAWESILLAKCAETVSSATSFRKALENFWKVLGFPERKDCSFQEYSRLKKLASALMACEGEDASILFDKQFKQYPDAIQKLETAITAYQCAKQQAAADYEQSLESIPLNEIEQQWRQAEASFWPFSWFGKKKLNRFLQSYASDGVASIEQDFHHVREMQSQLAIIKDSTLAENFPEWKEQDTETSTIRELITRADELRSSIIELGRIHDATNHISKMLHSAIRSSSSTTPEISAAREFLNQARDFDASLDRLAEFTEKALLDENQDDIVKATNASANLILENKTQIQRWTSWCDSKQKAIKAGLTDFVEALENGSMSPEHLLEQFRLSYARWWIVGIIDGNPVLRTFQRFKQEEAIEDFCKLDEIARETAATRAKQTYAHSLPSVDSVPRKSELGLLRHQMHLKRPSKSIRDVISGMSDYFGQLAPCLLMSPLSISQYLPAGHGVFDVVIFDEASQITTWDAIGAIARGEQTIIVGDPKQLPPTNFFGRSDNDESNDELEDHEKDLESILDEAQASGIPTMMLNWHYRSRHESLIAFSNWNYYDNKLVTFPAAETHHQGVSFQLVPDAIYDRGKSRTNRKEAEAIVEDAVRRMQENLELSEEDRLTFGVITFNSQQQTLIQDLLDESQRANPELDWYFSDERIEPTVVKNLENVQGDERDVMLFSITFGRDASRGEIKRTFGALNRDGGERRLNVAVTRARQELIVYSSFKAEELRAEGIKARGVKDLKNFLEYAEKGADAIIQRDEGSVGEFESPFEEAVADSLLAKGWEVVPQVGISGFRIDMGIVHPDKPGVFLAGIECDGETYHRSAAARDRDKTRQLILENLGWKILRVWSRDWWYDSESASELIERNLNELLAADRKNSEHSRPSVTFAELPTLATPVSEQVLLRGVSQPVTQNRESPGAKNKNNQQSGIETRGCFQITDLSDCSHEQDHFHEKQYDDDIRAMAMSILNNEAPVRDDVLAKRIARAHGFGRTGGVIRSRILDLLTDIASTDESTGRFLWMEEPQKTIDFRHPLSEDDRRGVDEISIAELLGLIQENPEFLNEDDPAIAYARFIGIGRLSKSARERIEEATTIYVTEISKD